MSNPVITAKGQLETFLPFQATVKKIDENNGVITAEAKTGKPFDIPPAYYGGVTDHGLFMHPSVGDTLLCVRVGGGTKGVTQALRIIPGEGMHEEKKLNDDTTPQGWSTYPKVKKGDVKVISYGASELFLGGSPADSEANLTTTDRSGLYICSEPTTSFITTVADVSQNITSGSRLISGDVIRGQAKGQVDIPLGNSIKAYSKIAGDLCGLYEGSKAVEASFLGCPRNAVLSEYRLVINEFAESSAFTGFDEEHSAAMSPDKKRFDRPAHQRAIDPRTSLALAPHQLVEIIAGNVVNSRGETLDINYGTVEAGNSEGRPIIEAMAYESDRLLSRRGLGYHFQLSTNSKASETSNDVENFIWALDKQGLLKINVPKGSGAGNVLFPTEAHFSPSKAWDGTFTKPLHEPEPESVPATLRDKDGAIVLPVPLAALPTKRSTGVRFVDNFNYFQNHKNINTDGVKQVRVNFTKHHNMYAAAEMLIANTIGKVIIPPMPAVCPGIIIGNMQGKPFETSKGSIGPDGEAGDNEVPFMSTVVVDPGRPALSPGGGVVVAGQDLTDEGDKGDMNQPYTNSFIIVEKEKGEFSAINAVKGAKNQKNPGGKSANINFEGAVDVSVGKDVHDQKSLVLDTAGSVIAWFGKDRNGRSLIVQTDGSVAVNVGGFGTADGAESFKKGKFDLRVNVTDKGKLSEREPPARLMAAGGKHASDYIISISEHGLVIAGMKPGAPMVIRNDGDLALESSGKLSLTASSVEVREGGTSPRKTHKAPTGQDQEPQTAETVAKSVKCVLDVMENLTKAAPEDEE